MNDSNEDQLAEQAKSLLDSSADKVSLKVQMRLQAARYEALKTARQTQAEQVLNTGNISINMPGWLGTLSTTSVLASVFIIFSLVWFSPINQDVLQTPVFEDMEMLSGNNELELYQNLDFYIWLSDEETLR